MIGKNFLAGDKKKGDRLLWLVGLGAVGLFAFLAAGTLEDARPKAQTPVTAEAAPPPSATGRIDGPVAAAPEAAEVKVSTRSFQRPKTTRTMTAPEGPGMGSVLKTIGALGLVILLLFGGAALGARYLKKLRMKPSGTKVLELVDVIALGPKRQVFVVSAYGRRIVVGATGDSMNVLSEFDADEIAAAAEPASRPAFADRLERDLERLERRPDHRLMEVEA